MRQIVRLGYGPLLASAVLTVLGLAVADGSAAGGGKQLEPQGTSDKQLREAIHVLRVTNYVLENANHDYGGHRVAAIRDIKAATKQLRLALEHGKGGKNPNKPPKKGKFQPEPQEISNFQLAEAIKTLEKTHAFLKSTNHDYGGHKKQAMHDLHEAIHQLHLALKFEKRKG